ncbi:MAG: cupin domain-containing protein [Solirubrobacterales bacterium]|nr:cupin domain-containing protein [Solirubrobacterales bacterium]
MTVVVDRDQRVLRTGDTLTIPRATPHKMWNADTEPASALWRTHPAGRTASWFRTLDRISDHGSRNLRSLPPSRPSRSTPTSFGSPCGPSRCSQSPGWRFVSSLSQFARHATPRVLEYWGSLLPPTRRSDPRKLRGAIRGRGRPCRGCAARR